MNKKYELTTETNVVSGVTLYRIKALRDFGNVKAGDLGGWVEGEKNLNQESTCWVYGSARVSGEAWVYDEARVQFRMIIFWNCPTTPFSVNTTDGYTMTLDSTNGKISAGCRYFDFEEARKWWEKRRGGTELGRERLDQVNFLEYLYQSRKDIQ